MNLKKKPDEKRGVPAYLATWADMMSLLLCFFVLLYAMSMIDMSKFQEFSAALSGNPIVVMESSAAGVSPVFEMSGSGIVDMPNLSPAVNPQGPGTSGESESTTAQEAKQELSRMASDFKTYFAEYDMQDMVDVSVGDYSLEFTLTEGISFDTGRANLKDEIIPILDMLGDELEKYPGTEISIEGHTDDVPINTPQFPSNWYLSSARAISVGMYLVDEKGIDPSRVDARGRGEYRPIASNETEEGRAKNRRVEIKVYSTLYSDVD